MKLNKNEKFTASGMMITNKNTRKAALDKEIKGGNEFKAVPIDMSFWNNLVSSTPEVPEEELDQEELEAIENEVEAEMESR